jgi:hypothetical protein
MLSWSPATRIFVALQPVEWNWHNPAGQLKDMATRSLLVKLAQRGWISLPVRRQAPPNRMWTRGIAPQLWNTRLLVAPLADPASLQVQGTSGDAAGREILPAALAEFHYMGYGGTVGENAQYLVIREAGRVLATVLFGSAAWVSRERDRFIGWSVEARQRNLPLITNNERFLLLPWVRVACFRTGPAPKRREVVQSPGRDHRTAP